MSKRKCFYAVIILATFIVGAGILWRKTAISPAVSVQNVDMGIDDQTLDDKANIELQHQLKEGQSFTPDDLKRATNNRANISKTLLQQNVTSATPPNGNLYNDAIKSTLAFYSLSLNDIAHQRGAQLGTAFVVDSSGVVVTCFHALNFAGPFVLTACFIDGRIVHVKTIVAVFPKADLAFVRLEGNSFTPFPMRSRLPVGSDVRVIGHPLSAHFFMEAGLIARYEPMTPSSEDHAVDSKLDLAIRGGPGFSGGPVLDLMGNVVGMEQSTTTITRGRDSYTIAVAVPTSTILSCLSGQHR